MDSADGKKPHRLKHLVSFLFIIGALSLIVTGCGPSAEELAAVHYTPLEIDDDWAVSTPEEQGLDPRLVAALYYDAAQLDTLYSVLVIKDGSLIAEGYFNEGSVLLPQAKKPLRLAQTPRLRNSC